MVINSEGCESCSNCPVGLHIMNVLPRILSAITILSFALCSLFAGATEPGKTQQLTSPDQVPRGLAKSEWSSIRAAYEAGRHAFQPIEGGWKARNPGQQWTTKFDGRGFLTEPRDGAWQWGLELKSYGFGGNQRAISGTPTVKAEGQRLTYQWDAAVQEWWVNDARGLEHGFTVAARPSEILNSQPSTLNFLLTTRGTLHPCVSADAQGVLFQDASGATVLNYTGLKVWDADGKVLASHFAPAEGGVQILVEESGARYPLTIDPVAQQAYLKPAAFGTTQAGDQFGYAVAISGDTVVIGAPNEDSSTTGVNSIPNDVPGPNSDSGAAYVFVRDSFGTWFQQAYLKASNTGAGDHFGVSVAVSGDTIVVGAEGEASSTGGVDGSPNEGALNSGAAYVFFRSGIPKRWTQQAFLKASVPDAGDFFGHSVAVSGDLIVVGAYGEASNATGVVGDPFNNFAPAAGAAYAYLRNGATWTFRGYLKASNTRTGQLFGYSVAVAGDTVVVGACAENSNATGVNAPLTGGAGTQEDNSASGAGAAYVFVRSAGMWAQQAYLKPSSVGTTQANDQFGIAVAISGDTIVVGAQGEASSTIGVNSTPNESANASGAAYVFVRIAGVWTQQAYLKASNAGASHQFGASVAVSDNTVVIGALQEDSNATGINFPSSGFAIGSGAAYVFIRSTGTWAQQAYLKASNAGINDHFGSVAVSGDTVVVGALGEDSNTASNPANNSAADAGAVYIFTGLGPPPDLDADGLPDFVETYFGTSPTVPGGSPISALRVSNQVSLRWPVSNPAGVTVTPEWSPDLITWLASGQTANGIPARTITITTPATGQRNAALDATGLPFAALRLRLTQP